MIVLEPATIVFILICSLKLELVVQGFQLCALNLGFDHVQYKAALQKQTKLSMVQVNMHYQAFGIIMCILEVVIL